jgi:hypothetical protein
VDRQKNVLHGIFDIGPFPVVAGRDYIVNDLLRDYRGHRVAPEQMPAEAPRVFAAWARGVAQRWRFVERLIKEGQTTGEFRRGADAAVASRFILSALTYQALLHVHLGMRRFAPCSTDRLFDASVDQWLQGLRSTARPSRK